MRALALFLAVLWGCSSGGGGGTGGGSATGGGGSGTGGGTATGGGMSTGGGTGTGGGTSTGGVGTFLRVGMYDQVYAGGPDGRMHLLFSEGAAERIFYGSCTSSCGSPASWSPVQLASVTQLDVLSVGAEGLGVDSTGRVHALISGVPGPGKSANTVVYATCASNCGSAASWQLLDLTPVAVDNPITTNETFMVTPAGQLSFLTSGQTNSFPSRYVTCTSSCTSIGSWSAGAVLNGNPLYAARDAAGVTHIVFDQGDTAMGDGLLFYGRCAASCTQMASWQLSALGFIHRTANYTTGFAVTASGRVFLAYNQGVAMVSTSDNRKLFVNSCMGATCLDLNTWSSFSLGVPDEGSQGLWLEASGEALGLATIDQFDLNARFCETGCTTAAGWSALTVADNSAAMNAAVPPDTGSGCAGSSESASWWPNKPTIGASSSGIVIGHSPYAIVKCPGVTNPSRTPTLGRVISTF